MFWISYSTVEQVQLNGHNSSVVEIDTIVVSRPKVRVLERNASDGGEPCNFNPIWKSVLNETLWYTVPLPIPSRYFIYGPRDQFFQGTKIIVTDPLSVVSCPVGGKKGLGMRLLACLEGVVWGRDYTLL